MAQNKITIKFEAIGDKTLSHAIEQLRLSQIKLEKGSKAYQRALRKLNREQTKQNANSVLGVKNNRLLANSFATLRSKLLLVSFGAGLVAASIGRVVKMYGEQEKAQRLLARQLGGTSKRLLEFASAQQQITTFGDEVTISAMATASAYTKNEDQLERLTAVAMDYAVFAGKDLNQAVLDVSKSIFSSTNLLSRQGIAFEGTVGSADRFNNALDAIAEKAGGLAEEEAKTLLGALDQMGDAVGDLGENIGSLFVPIVNVMAKTLKAVAEHFDENKIRHYAAAITLLGLAYLGTSGAVMTLVASMKTLAKWMVANKKAFLLTILAIGAAELADRMGLLDKVIEKLAGTRGKDADATKEQMKEKHALNRITQEEIFLMDGHLSLDEKLQLARLKATQMGDLVKAGFASELEVRKSNLELLKAEIAIENAKTEQKLNNYRLLTDSFLNAVSQIETLNQAMMAADAAEDGIARKAELREASKIKSKRLRTLKENSINDKFDKNEEDRQAKALHRAKIMRKWKAAAALSNVALGITQTWRDPYMDPYSKTAMTIFQAITGAAQVATIYASEFAHGGLIGGQSHSQGGTPIIAERGEFIMSRSAVDALGVETMNRINQGRGGGDVNVTFTGNVMSQDFIENEAIPQIRDAIKRGADIGVS